MKASTFFITGIFIVTSAAAYSVKKGDSLSAIAKDHYGTWDKWKDIWKLNRFIKNPDLIYPNQKLRIPGNERLLIASNDQKFAAIHTPARSQEWRLLPEQPWEKFIFATAPEVDPDGFDRRSRVAKRVAEKTTATVTVASDRLAIEGEIVNARTEYGQIFLGEQVFIRADEQLQVGTIYSISSGPQKLVSKRDQRVGFAYDLSGKVKIIGVRDGLFIGTIISAQRPIFRNNLLIPEVKPLVFSRPMPSEKVIAASVLTTEAMNVSMMTEQQLVVLDAGSTDGVRPGMIFRHYLKEDPGTGEGITTKDYLIESEIQVLEVKDRFSTGIVLQSRSILRGDDLVLSLMDLKDFQKNSGMQTFIQDYDESKPLDDLDQLDDSQGLGEKEDYELRQLEKTDPNSSDVAPALGDEPAPNDLVDQSINAAPPQEPPATAPTPEDAPIESIPSTETPGITEPTVEPTPAPPATDEELDGPATVAPTQESVKDSSSDGAVLDTQTAP